MLLFSLACSIRPTSILKGSRRKRVSLPPLGKVTRAGVNQAHPKWKGADPDLGWEALLCSTHPTINTLSLVFAITSAFALFSQMFCVVAAFILKIHLSSYPQLSVCCLVHNNVIFHIYRYFFPISFTPSTLVLVLLSLWLLAIIIHIRCDQ